VGRFEKEILQINDFRKRMSVTWGGDIEKLMEADERLNATIQIILTDVALEISNNAKENAPYLT